MDTRADSNAPRRPAPPWDRNEYLAPGSYGVATAIEIVANRVPDRLAIMDETTRLTYEELVSTIRRVAGAVAARHSDGASAVVALCEHGTPAALLMLGVLGAGRLLVPLDARDPRERLAAIVGASGATLVVTTREHAATAQAIAPHCSTLFLDEAVDFPGAVAGVDVRPGSPGLVIFTSGSTGTPKGVVIAHTALVADALRAQWSGNFMPGDRVALTASFSYVGAPFILIGALCNGASVLTYDPRARGQRGFPDWVRANDIHAVQLMTPLLRSLTDDPRGTTMPTLRRVGVYGDVLYGRDIARARALFGPDTEFNTGFGSTESSLVASLLIPPEREPDPGVVPLGEPCPWAEVRIVDPETGDDVPDGEPGQLVASSPQVALGYIDDPALTNECFFTSPDGRRGFRFSDLVRRRPDGLLEHVGRVDSRVKIRGALVALSEVERGMAELDGVGSVAVVGAPLPDGAHRLVAYVVPAPGTAPSRWQLRRDAGTRLPGTMVPSAVVFVDELPLNPNGKVIRSALPPAPDPVRAPYRRPRGYDCLVADLVAEVLGVDQVGLDDDFFDLGADSLGVVELVVAIRERFGVDIVASTILEAPTVAELAPHLRNRRDRRTSVVVPLRTVGRATPMFCFTGSGAPALSLHALAEAIGAAGPEERPFYAIQPRGLEERALPDRSIGAAARRGLRAIRSTHPSGPFVLGGYSFGALVAFDLACRIQDDGRELPLLVILDSAPPGTTIPAPTRAQRLERRRRELRTDVPAGSPGAGTMAGRAARIAWRSISAHAERRASLLSAGLVPRPGLEQYGLFLRLNNAMARAYRTERTYGGPAIIVRSDLPPPGGRAFPDLGWSRFLTGPSAVIETPGDHLAMIRRPYAATLAARLTTAIANLDGLGTAASCDG